MIAMRATAPWNGAMKRPRLSAPLRFSELRSWYQRSVGAGFRRNTTGGGESEKPPTSAPDNPWDDPALWMLMLIH